MADSNELLEQLRYKTSIGADHDDNEDFNLSDWEEICELFIKLDINCLDGKLPDGWALNKLSKSNVS